MAITNKVKITYQQKKTLIPFLHIAFSFFSREFPIEKKHIYFAEDNPMNILTMVGFN